MNSGPRKTGEAMEQKVLRFIRENRLIAENSRIVVAVSGGPDSVSLLSVLLKLRDELNTHLHVAHLNHKLRGAESDEDARYVSTLAERFGLPFTVKEIDVNEYRSSHGGTLEEAAREARYDFLAETAKAAGAGAVAAGHTSDDNIETILLHLVRGTGTRGLRGLQAKTGWDSPSGRVDIVRPLLNINRSEVLEYCRKNNLEPRTDSSNLSLVPLRNRIRQQLIPLLESYNERIGDALLRAARVAGDELDFMDNAAKELWEKVAFKNGEGVILDKEGFTGLPAALQRHLLRQAIEGISGSLKDIETRHIDDIMDTLYRQTGKSINLPGGLIFAVEYDRFLLGREASSMSPFPPLDGEYEIKIPGETGIPGWQITSDVTDREDAESGDDRFTAYLDLDKTGNSLKVRPRKTADRFHPLGMEQSKKIGEYMIDAKIPRAWRKRVPVVCNDRQILWIVGWRIDNRVRVTGDTGQVLRLEFRQTAGS